jgi:hypothetical protein
LANHPQIEVKRIERDGELYVLTRSLARAEKERAMRQRVLKGLRKDLAKLSNSIRSGRVVRKELILHTARTTRGTLALSVVLPQRGDPEGHRIGLALGPQKIAQCLVPTRRLSIAH